MKFSASKMLRSFNR